MPLWRPAVGDGFNPLFSSAKIVCHCLLIETDTGLVLVDTGFGFADVRNPQRLSTFFRLANRVRLREADTARRQIEAKTLPHQMFATLF